MGVHPEPGTARAQGVLDEATNGDLQRRLSQAPPGDFVEVTREEFETLKRDVIALRDRAGSDQMQSQQSMERSSRWPTLSENGRVILGAKLAQLQVALEDARLARDEAAQVATRTAAECCHLEQRINDVRRDLGEASAG